MAKAHCFRGEKPRRRGSTLEWGAGDALPCPPRAPSVSWPGPPRLAGPPSPLQPCLSHEVLPPADGSVLF